MPGLDLKVARVKLGLSQFELALRLGIHPARLSEMETAKRPIPEVVALGVRAELSGIRAARSGRRP